MHSVWMVSIVLGTTFVSSWQYTKNAARSWINQQMSYAAAHNLAIRSPKITRLVQSDMRDVQIIGGKVWTWHE